MLQQYICMLTQCTKRERTVLSIPKFLTVQPLHSSYLKRLTDLSINAHEFKSFSCRLHIKYIVNVSLMMIFNDVTVICMINRSCGPLGYALLNRSVHTLYTYNVIYDRLSTVNKYFLL